MKPPAPASALSDRSLAFIQARAERPAPAVGTPGDDETVDVMGAVAQPGQYVMGPSLETLKQALEAAVVASSAASLRVRPGDDVLSKLLASDSGGSPAVEIPLAALPQRPIYLRNGDIIEVAAADSPPAVAVAPAEHSEPSVAAASVPVEAPKPSGESAAVISGLPPVPAAPAPAPVADTPNVVSPPETPDVKAELAKLRSEMDTRLAVLHAEIEKLETENARLSARVERPAPLTAPVAAPSARTVPSKPSPAAKPLESARTETAKPAGEPQRAATVLVSGSVRNPGSYSIDEVKTVRGAVRAAGNRGDGDMEAVELRPDGQRGALVGMGLGMGVPATKTVVDLVAVDAGKGGDVALHGGEVIFVPPASRSGLAR